MSILTKASIITEAQKVEALLRMKKLGIHENAIREFMSEGKLNKSEPAWGNKVGVLYWLTEKEQKMVKEWEEETGNLVYHVIVNNLSFGLCYSLLYVSKCTEEWEEDGLDLSEGCPYAYVKNVTDDECSEYGRIGIKPAFGGVVRVA